MDFQTFGDAKFKNENVFSMAFARVFIRVLKRKEDTFSERMKEIIRDMEEILRRKDESFELQELFEYISDICGAATAPVVLIIDEADSATNNQVFLDFLSQLRAYYIDRDYYIEARTRNLRRTDVIVDYNGVQYIIEMKIWHGEEYHRRE